MNDRYNLWKSPTLVAAADYAFGDDGLCPPCVHCDEPTVAGTSLCQAHLDDHVEAAS